MQWTYHYLQAEDADAVMLALLRAVKADDGVAFIPAAEVTPAVAERLQRTAGVAAGNATEGSFECNINNRPAIVKVKAVDDGYRLSLHYPPAV